MDDGYMRLHVVREVKIKSRKGRKEEQEKGEKRKRRRQSRKTRAKGGIKRER